MASTTVGGTDFELLSFSPVDFNPLTIPAIFAIWPEESAILAKEAYDEEKLYLLANPHTDFGRAYLLTARMSGGEPQPAGISGFFPVDEDLTRFFLRWHGVLDHHRGQGVTRWAIGIVADEIRAVYPSAQHLIEQMPDIASRSHVAQSFSRLGFSPLPDLIHHDWSPHPWREWELTLRPHPEPHAKKLPRC